MTALAFAESLKASDHKGMVHTAAASTLGQMLVRICLEDGIPLVNVVRSRAQVELLRNLGAEYVVDSSSPQFWYELSEAVEATGASLVFDPIGGGTVVGTILYAIERASARPTEYSRYGSSCKKQAYIYGALDVSPTIISGRDLGFSWSISGWLLSQWLQSVGPAKAELMRERVMAGLDTTFATHYNSRIALSRMLERDTVLRYNARRTGEKFIVVAD